MKKENFDKLTLVNGDSLTILSEMPTESVDAILTDPPYSSGGMSMSARQADPADKYQSSGCKRHYPPCRATPGIGAAGPCGVRVLARGACRSAPDGVHGLASAARPDRRRAGRGLEMAGHRALEQAECPPADRQVPPAVRARSLRLQGQPDPRNALMPAGPVFLPPSSPSRRCI